MRSAPMAARPRPQAPAPSYRRTPRALGGAGKELIDVLPHFVAALKAAPRAPDPAHELVAGVDRNDQCLDTFIVPPDQERFDVGGQRPDRRNGAHPVVPRL